MEFPRTKVGQEQFGIPLDIHAHAQPGARTGFADEAGVAFPRQAAAKQIRDGERIATRDKQIETIILLSFISVESRVPPSIPTMKRLRCAVAVLVSLILPAWVAIAGSVATGNVAGTGKKFCAGTFHTDGRGTPRLAFPAQTGIPVAAGRQGADDYLRAHRDEYKLPADPSDLKLLSTRESLLGTHYRYQQMLNGVPVEGGGVVVSISRDGEVYQVFNNAYPVDVPPAPVKTLIGEERALDVAWNHLRVHGRLLHGLRSELVYLPVGGGFRLAYKTLVAVEAPYGYWEHQIDAASGRVISVRDTAIHEGKGTVSPKDFATYAGPIKPRAEAVQEWQAAEVLRKQAVMSAQANTVSGTALVFDPDPRTALADEALVDSSPTLAFTAAYVTRPLRDISESGGVYTLDGPWVVIKDFDAPTDPPSTTANGQWTATRGNNAFNDVMTYFHIDQNQRYLQSLGYTGATGIQYGPIEADSDGLDGDEDAEYLPLSNQISFGHGGVDSNEDATVILHEYGHAIVFDIVPFWFGGDTGAIGEGFGDYWGASYRSTTTNGNTFHPEWTAPWFGHSADTWPGRFLNMTSLTYEPGHEYDAHETIDGIADYGDQLWSTPLFQAFLALEGMGCPRTDMDKIVIESFFGIGDNPTMRDMAGATVTVAARLFPNGPHAGVYRDKFLAQNILGNANDPVISAQLEGSSSIDVWWVPCTSHYNVMVAWNTNGSFGTPDATVTYKVGDTLPGGGTVLYIGSGTSLLHSGLAAGTQYFYKAWSYVPVPPPSYSPGVICSASTHPVNDMFANRLTITGSSANITGTNRAATKEPGEPDHADGSPAARSVWWTWTAPSDGLVFLSTQGSTFDSLAAVYTGTSVSTLTATPGDTEYWVIESTNILFTEITFPVTAGTAYQIAVDSLWSSGDIALALTFTPGTPPSFVITLAGSSSSDGSADGTGFAASFWSPNGVAVDASGNVYVADSGNNKIRKISPARVVTTLAGSGDYGSTNGTGTAASFENPSGVAVDASGNVYVADSGNNKIRKISPAGAVTTLAGSGAYGSNDGTGTVASFENPSGVAVDASGNVYVADSGNNEIRKISSAGVVTTLAGSGAYGSTDGTGSAASFVDPGGVAVDASGDVYVADSRNNRIRKISSTGVVTTLAGSGDFGSTDGTGSAASFGDPGGVAVDASGNVYVADSFISKIRKISSARVVTTLAGSGDYGSTDGIGSAASFKFPSGVAVDASGNVYVADPLNNEIREIIRSQKSVPVITWFAPQPITYGTALSATQLNAEANVPGTFVYTPAAGVVLNVGAQTLSLTFTPADTADYTTASATQTLTVILADYQAFLQKLFPLVLGRPIDSGALSAFTAAMAGGVTRSEVYGDLIGSPEYNAWQVEPVIRLYYAAFNRIPDYAGLQNWSIALHAGALSLTDAADQFATSAEFLQTYGSLDDTGFVQQLYRNVLGREADTGGLNNWVAYLNGGATRGQVLVGFSESDEFKTDMANQVEIIRLYYLLFQRMPTTTELRSWLAFLQGDDETDTLFAQGYPAGLDSSDYVQLVFQGFLRRNADSGALSAFGGALDAGTLTHGGLVDTLLSSDEFNQSVAPVSRLYLAAFRRAPDAPGLDNWVTYVRAGNSLQSVADAFVASEEFQLTYGSLDDTQYVTLLYQNVLGRAPDPTGLQDWVNLLGSGSTRGQVLVGFSESPEGIALFAPTVRTFLHYFAFLNATPTQADLDYWKNYLTTLDDQMRAAFLDDPAFSGGG